MEKTDQQKALEIAKVLQDEKANDVAVLDISGLNSWTDYFVIATVNSAVHSQGLYKSIKVHFRKRHGDSQDGPQILTGRRLEPYRFGKCGHTFNV